MAFVLKQALEFNKFTMGLAAAGLAYAATIGSETPTPPSAVPIGVKLLSTATIVTFAAAILFGVFVMGRAAKLDKGENDKINDGLMKTCGQIHSLALVLGLLLAGFLMLNKIWRII